MLPLDGPLHWTPWVVLQKCVNCSCVLLQIGKSSILSKVYQKQGKCSSPEVCQLLETWSTCMSYQSCFSNQSQTQWYRCVLTKNEEQGEGTLHRVPIRLGKQQVGWRTRSRPRAMSRARTRPRAVCCNLQVQEFGTRHCFPHSSLQQGGFPQQNRKKKKHFFAHLLFPYCQRETDVELRWKENRGCFFFALMIF